MPCPSRHAPEWTEPEFERRNNDLRSLLQLELNDSVLQAISRMSVDGLITVYGKFFHHVWKICKEENGWKGNIVYEKLTPQWLHGDIVVL